VNTLQYKIDITVFLFIAFRQITFVIFKNYDIRILNVRLGQKRDAVPGAGTHVHSAACPYGQHPRARRSAPPCYI